MNLLNYKIKNTHNFVKLLTNPTEKILIAFKLRSIILKLI